MDLSKKGESGEPAQKRRRHGPELEAAILDAAWQELNELGYVGLTLDGVAQRAGTSRPVLHRRWPTRADLVVAAIRRRWTVLRPPAPDTGSLRSDVTALLRSMNDESSRLLVLAVMEYGAIHRETNRTISELRLEFAGDHPSRMRPVLDRAIERGEIGPDGLEPRIERLPFDLLRHEILMTMQPVEDQTIRSIVDDIFMPLATASRQSRQI